MLYYYIGHICAAAAAARPMDASEEEMLFEVGDHAIAMLYVQLLAAELWDKAREERLSGAARSTVSPCFVTTVVWPATVVVGGHWRQPYDGNNVLWAGWW